MCREISISPVSLKNTFASLLGSKSWCCKYFLTSSAQVFAGAWLQLENPSAVNASPACSSRGSCSSHAWQHLALPEQVPG